MDEYGYIGVNVNSPLKVLEIMVLSTFNVGISLTMLKAKNADQDEINKEIEGYTYAMKKNLEALNNFNTNKNKKDPEKKPFFQVFDGDVNSFLKDLLNKKVDPDTPKPNDMDN